MRTQTKENGKPSPTAYRPQSTEDGVDEISHKILASLFYNGECSIESLARTAGIFEGLAKYHLNDLKKEWLIQRTLLGGVSFDALSSAATYGLSPRGREYVVKNLLQK